MKKYLTTDDFKKKTMFFLDAHVDNDNIHSPNEKYDVANFYKGIATTPYFFKYFSEQQQ